jgi:hypothetical protein
MSPSFCFVVTTWKQDLHYAKVLIESLHYWHPEIPTKVIVDGDANVESLRKFPNVITVDRTEDLQNLHGLHLRGLLSDLNLFFFDDFDYYVRVDAASVLVGDIVAGIRANLPFDFLALDGVQLDLNEPMNNRQFSQYAFSPEEMRELGEPFPDKIIYFSGGHFAARRRLFDRDYIARWRPHMGIEFRKDLLFKFNDQSFLNFAVNSLGQGSLTGKLWHVTINGKAKPETFPDVTLERLTRKESPIRRIIHYTGPSRRPRFRDHNFGWSLEFFHRRLRHRLGTWTQLRDETARAYAYYTARKTWSGYYQRAKTRLRAGLTWRT